MDDVTVTTFDINGVNYIVMNDLNINNNRYVYLVNEHDDEDFLIRKVDTTTNNVVLNAVSKDEFFLVLNKIKEENI